MEADIVEFKEVIKELMSDNNLNITKLSENAGVSAKAITYWFSGAFYPNLDSLIKLANYFHTSIDYLFGKTDIFVFEPLLNNSNFILRYNQLKTDNNLTDYRIAKLCNIQNSTIAKWQKRNKIPETTNLIKLSNIFCCSIEYLIGRA